MTHHIIEIQVLRVWSKVSGKEEVFNDVGIMIPPVLNDLQEGDIVEFHYDYDETNANTNTIDIEFEPQEWVTTGYPDMTLTQGTPQQITVTGVVSNEIKKIKISAMCNSINEKAIGNSPPEMNLGP